MIVFTSMPKPYVIMRLNRNLICCRTTKTAVGWSRCLQYALVCNMFLSFKMALCHQKVKKIRKIFCKSLFLENVSKSKQNDLKFHKRELHFCI